MSGICGNGHNKFNSCQDCPDRSIEPNCHETCEGYLFRTKKKRELNERIRREKQVDALKKETIYESKRRANLIK